MAENTPLTEQEMLLAFKRNVVGYCNARIVGEESEHRDASSDITEEDVECLYFDLQSNTALLCNKNDKHHLYKTRYEYDKEFPRLWLSTFEGSRGCIYNRHCIEGFLEDGWLGDTQEKSEETVVERD